MLQWILFHICILLQVQKFELGLCQHDWLALTPMHIEKNDDEYVSYISSHAT